MERKSLESAAATYSYLRGLLSVPAGVLMILAGLANMDWIPPGQAWAFWGIVPLTVVAYLFIVRYYNETYGRVTLPRRMRVKSVIATIVSAIVVSAAVQVNWSLDLPVNATAIAFGLVLLLYYAIGVGVRTHHAIICGALLVTGSLPVWGDMGSAEKINVGLMLAGVMFIVAGILDNGALKRTFGPEGLNAGNGDAGA